MKFFSNNKKSLAISVLVLSTTLIYLIGSKQIRILQMMVLPHCAKIEVEPDNSTISFWKDILEASDEQLKMNKTTILETLKFMLKETDQNDPELINFVRSLIHEPSKGKLILEDKTGLVDFSQSGQSAFMDKLLNSKRNGFLIEAGAFDGEFQSNSLFFETQRDWNGILIEPVPRFFEKIIKKNRKLYKINACIAKDKPSVQQFRVHGVFSGRDNAMTNSHKNIFGGNFQYFYAPCFSLHTILKAINVKKVDFFSLDLEGGEYDVLKSLDFKKIDITTLLIEHMNDPLRKPLIKKVMDGQNYTLIKDVHDFFYMKN